jgi:hypothetical protein
VQLSLFGQRTTRDGLFAGKDVKKGLGHGGGIASRDNVAIDAVFDLEWDAAGVRNNDGDPFVYYFGDFNFETFSGMISFWY